MYIASRRQLQSQKPIISRKNTIPRTVLGDISNVRITEQIGKKLDKKTQQFVGRPAIETVPMTDLDKADIGQPLLCPEYATSIYNYYSEVESKFCPNPEYMTFQKEINKKMRAVLIDWLVDVHYKFKLQPETFYLTVNYIDRFLEKEQIERKKLQLVGVTAMLIASKYEEIYFPEIRDFVYITDKSYSKDEIKRMEGHMCNVLGFDLTIATLFRFLTRYLKAAHQSEEYESVVKFIAERTQQEYSLLKYLPSKLAAACVYLANKYERLDEWNSTLVEYTHYTAEDVKECAEEIEECIKKGSTNLNAVWRKYTRSIRHKASYIVYEYLHLPPPIVPK